MPTFSLKIRKADLDAEVTRMLGRSPQVKAATANYFQLRFKRAKSQMMRDFNSHRITQELMMGPRGVNISDTLDGYGNLFAFIGFEAGSHPTEGLRELLENVNWQQTVYRNRGWYFRVETPSQEAIAAQTQMPWINDSWALQVERSNGISGLSAFIYKKWANSRSGRGLQVPYEHLEDATFRPKPYVTEILRKFRGRLNNIAS